MLKSAEYMIDNGCIVNQIDTYGQNPIFYPVREGHLAMVNFLIEKGSDVDLIDNNGQTPLFYGAKHGRLEIC